MIARILGVVALGLFALSGVQTFNLARSDRELTATQTLLAQQESANIVLQGQIDRSETARQAEREQCAADFAGEVERAKIEIEKVRKAGVAISRLSQVCTPLTPVEKTKLYRDVWGAQPK